MLNSASATTAIVAALAAGSGAAMADPTLDREIVQARAQAFVSIRSAQVELYCDHPSLAVAAIRAALLQLETSSTRHAATMLASLDEAAWHVRRHETAAAHRALDRAVSRLLV